MTPQLYHYIATTAFQVNDAALSITIIGVFHDGQDHESSWRSELDN